MSKVLQFFQMRLVVRLVLIVTAVIVLLTAGNMLLQIENTKSASESAIANYGMNLARSYAEQMDVKSYIDFMQDPKENDSYWAIREELNRYRSQIGAMYVYLVKINDQQEPLMMIDGQPKDSDSASPINEVTDIPADAVQSLRNGEIAHSALIENPKYGTYISAYSPVKDADGKFVGVLGIDIEASEVDQISADILRGSMPYYSGLGALTLLALLFIAWSIARAIRPLRFLVTATENIAKGDLAQANAILAANPIRSKDEIGSAYRSTKQMSDNLNELMAMITSNVKGTSGQLTTSLEVFTQESHQLVQLNQVISATAQKVDEGTQTQQHGASESARSMFEITQSIGRVSEAVMHVSEASQQALHSAESGNETILRMKGQIDTIAAAASNTQELIETMNGFSQQIGQVLRVIVDIAEQTKLLALNASIEAARAGDQGSGFAVVAGEVRKLADAAATSTSQIASLLTNIQNTSTQIRETMNAGTAEISEGIQLSEHAAKAFQIVVDSFRFVTSQIQEISASAEQISAGSQEVAASVGEIAEIAKASSANTREIHQLAHQQLQAARQIADSANHLSGMAHEMNTAIKKISV